MRRSYSIYLDDFSGLFALIEYFSQTGEKWIFRGQANAQWTLKPTLERAIDLRIKQHNSPIKNTEVERDIMEMGRRILGARPDTVFTTQDNLELLAYLQHYGAVTRLLDFTDSFVIALYFAVDTSDADYATVWCVNRRAINGTGTNRNIRRDKALDVLNNGNESYGNVQS